MVTDGTGFRLRIEFADGTRIVARGSNSFPKGYGEAAAAFDELFHGHLKKYGAEPDGS